MDEALSKQLMAGAFARSRQGRITLAILAPFATDDMPEQWRDAARDAGTLLDPRDRGFVDFFVARIRNRSRSPSTTNLYSGVRNPFDSKTAPGVYMRGLQERRKESGVNPP